MQGRRIETEDRRTARQLDLCLLHPELAFIFWMTMINRSVPEAPPSVALTKTEIGLLDQLINDKGKIPHQRKDLAPTWLRSHA
jgi:hypothetical protein